MTAPESIRDDWLDTRSAFFRDRAAELFASSPVASRFERRLREEYLAYCARTAELVDPDEFAAVAATEKWRAVARLGFFGGGLIGAVAGFAFGGLVAAVVLGLVGAVIGMYLAWPLGVIGAEVFLARVDAVSRDRAAYGAWRAAAATPVPVCVCSYRSRVHDADCPARGS